MLRKNLAHAAPVGSGEEGKRCRDCRYLRRVGGKSMNRLFHKCGLMEGCWTHGSGSDIRCKDPACRFFSAADILPVPKS